MSERAGYAGPSGFTGTQLLLAALGGAVAGAAVAYLTAPKTGRETRAKLTEMFEDGREKVRSLPGATKVAGVAARDAFVTAMREDAKG